MALSYKTSFGGNETPFYGDKPSLISGAVAISGQLYSYNNIFEIASFSEPYASGQAAQRYRLNNLPADTATFQKRGAKNMSQKDREKISLLGIMGEVVSSYALGIPFEIENSDRTADLIFTAPNGAKVPVEVKTSDKWPNILVNEEHFNRADPDTVYFCVKKTGYETYALIGWIAHNEFEQVAQRANPNNDGEAFIVKEKYLHPFKQFIGDKL